MVDKDKKLHQELRRCMFLSELDKIEDLAMKACTKTGTNTEIGKLCMNIVTTASSLKDDLIDPTLYNDSYVNMNTLSNHLRMGKKDFFALLRKYNVFNTKNRPMPQYLHWFRMEVKTYYSDNGYKCKSILIYMRKKYINELKKTIFSNKRSDLCL